MLTVVVLVLSLIFLPSPWKFIVPVVFAILDLAETGFVLWWSQRGTTQVGVQTLVGRSAIAVGALRPSGKVKIDGELWEARSATPVDPGGEVLIERVDGLVLDVSPSDPGR